MRRQTVAVTPDYAKELLNRDTHLIDRIRVEVIKDRILTGKWKEDNGQFVKIINGRIENGHHRLTAIAELGLAINFRIQYEEN